MKGQGGGGSVGKQGIGVQPMRVLAYTLPFRKTVICTCPMEGGRAWTKPEVVVKRIACSISAWRVYQRRACRIVKDVIFKKIICRIMIKSYYTLISQKVIVVTGVANKCIVISSRDKAGAIVAIGNIILYQGVIPAAIYNKPARLDWVGTITTSHVKVILYYIPRSSCIA